MNWKPEEKDVIDYLYGAMTIEEKDRFETYMQANQELQKEVNELRQTMNILPSFQDEEVIPPVPLHLPLKSSSGGWRNWLYPVSIAASITIILLTGYSTNFSLSFNDNGFELGFVKKANQQEVLSEQQIEALIARRLDNYAAEVDAKLTTMQSGLAQQLNENQALTQKQIKKVTNGSSKTRLDENQVLKFISQLREENEQMMQNFYVVSAEEQKTYLRNILLGYSDYIEEQRQEDMRFFRASLLDIKSDSELKQEATDKILANIISSVNNQNSPINNSQSLD